MAMSDKRPVVDAVIAGHHGRALLLEKAYIRKIRVPCYRKPDGRTLRAGE